MDGKKHFKNGYSLRLFYPGYIEDTTKHYPNVVTHLEEPARFYIVSNVENENEYTYITQTIGAKPILRLTENQAWLEILKKP
jgi:hypothetical protein